MAKLKDLASFLRKKAKEMVPFTPEYRQKQATELAKFQATPFAQKTGENIYRFFEKRPALAQFTEGLLTPPRRLLSISQPVPKRLVTEKEPTTTPQKVARVGGEVVGAAPYWMLGGQVIEAPLAAKFATTALGKTPVVGKAGRFALGSAASTPFISPFISSEGTLKERFAPKKLAGETAQDIAMSALLMGALKPVAKAMPQGKAPKIKVKAPEAKQPVQILGEQLEKLRRLPISPEVVQRATGGIGKEPYAPSIVSKTLAGTPSTGKSLKPIIPQDVLDNLHRAFLSDDKEGARALYKSVSEEFSLPPMSQFEKGAQKLKKVKVSPYRGQIGGLEKEFDELIGYEPMGAHWKQEYTMRQKLLDETKAAAPPEVVKEIDKIENQLADLRFARERWEKLNEGVKQAPLKSLQEQQALKRAREEEAKRLEGEIGQLEKKIEKLRTAEQKKKYAFNVNLEKLGLTPKEKKVIGTTIDTIKPELEKIKGKRLSNREVINAAKKSEILTNISTREETLAAEAATLKARQRLVELDKDIGRLLKKGDTAELRAKMKDLVEGLRVVSGSAADTGRKLQALSIKAGDESVRSALLKEIGKVEKNTDLIVREAAKVDWNNANSITNFYRKFVKPSTMEILDEYRYNNMLSNPRTHIRNAFSNLIQTFVTRPATLIATGKPVEAAQYYQGALKGLPEAVEAFKKSFTGKTPITKPDIGLISSGKLPKFFTIPTRAMEATDRFFSTLIKGGELARGATPKQAEEAAEYSLFRAGLFPEGQGKLLNAIDSLTAWTYKAPKAVRWFVPFIRTPMNFAKQWIEYSPAGLATLPGAAKKKEQLAKTLIGSAIAAIGAKFALDGNTTWSVPTDPKQKELFYASGRKPFSVKIGDTWVPMMYAGPFAMALALPAAVRYYNDESRTSLTDSQVKKLTQSVMSMAEFLSGQTFLEGINNFVKFFSGDVDYSLPGNLAFTAGQLIPQEGLVRYISTIVDPIYRKGKTFGEGLKKNIPLLSKTLEPYTTPTGELSRREPINYILPYDVGIPKTEYEPLLQQRTQKLQQNALINQLTKEGEQLATSRTEPLAIGDKETAALLAYYGFYDLIKKEPKSSIEQKMLADKIYQKAGDVFESEEIDDATKEKIFQAIGLTPEEVTYDYFTRLADDLQMEAILEMTAGKTGDDLVKALLEMRRESEGSRKPLLTDTIIGKMVDEGVISAGVGNLLKSYEWDKEGGGLKKTAGKGKKIKVAAPKFKAPSLGAAPKTVKINLPEPYKIKVAGITPPPVKRLTVAPDYSKMIKIPTRPTKQIGFEPIKVSFNR